MAAARSLLACHNLQTAEEGMFKGFMTLMQAVSYWWIRSDEDRWISAICSGLDQWENMEIFSIDDQNIFESWCVFVYPEKMKSDVHEQGGGREGGILSCLIDVMRTKLLQQVTERPAGAHTHTHTLITANISCNRLKLTSDSFTGSIPTQWLTPGWIHFRSAEFKSSGHVENCWLLLEN